MRAQPCRSHSDAAKLKGFRPYTQLLCCLSLLLLIPAAAGAQTGLFFDEFGAGPRATAMGQAFTAIADDFSAAYYNPAGLSRIEQIFQGTVGGVYAQPSLWANFPGNEALNLNGQTSSHGLLLGIASNLDIERVVKVFPWFKRLSFGMVAYVNMPQILSAHMGPVDSRPHFLRHDKGFELLAIAISFAVEIMDWCSVGGGFIPGQDAYADIHSFAAVNKHSDPVMGLRLNITEKAETYVIPVAGVMVRPPLPYVRDVNLSLGVAYRGKNMSHQGKGTVNQAFGFENNIGNPIIGINYPTVTNLNLAGFSPQQVAFGISATIPLPLPVLIAYDMTWKNFSQYETTMEQTPVPGFRDTFTHRVGVEVLMQPDFSPPVLRNITRIALRGGYYFEPTPVEDLDPSLVATDTPSNNIFDSDQDVFSAGFGVTLATGAVLHDLQFFFQYHQFHNRDRMSYIDSAYAYFQGVPVYGRYIPVEYGGHAWATGGSYTLRF